MCARRTFQAERNFISQRKNLLIQFVHGHQSVRCPNRAFCVHQPSAVPSVGGVFVVAGCVCAVCWRWWCDVMWCDVMWYDVTWLAARWDEGNVVGCAVTWWGGNVVRCEMSRHVMPCDVTSCDVVTCHVWWCGVMSCHVISRHVIWRDVMWRCQGTGCYAVVMRCACAMWLAVKSCYVMQSGCVLWWIGRWCAVSYGMPMSQYYDSVLQSTKKYYSVLQSTTVLLTTK